MYHLFALLFVLLTISTPGVFALLLLHRHRRQINRFLMQRAPVSETTVL